MAENGSDQKVDGEKKDGAEAQKRLLSRTEVSAYLTDIAKKILDTKSANLHSMLAINDLLRQPNANELFTGELKEQAKDIWLKLKSTGLQVNDPPILFGLPSDFPTEDAAAES